ncbi:MAG: methyltransferase [Aquificaceae bacterium]|nr:methyltransferase [Aquificaceae bacterium]MDW8236807.1 methyltransferase [Aquificaceae bacterium]
MKILIDKLVQGGLGLGKSKDGKKVFVPFALPGEEVKIRIQKQTKDHDFGLIEEIISKSELRTNPSCPHYYVCGGCQLQHVSKEGQIKLKESILCENLQRIGKVDDFELKSPVFKDPWEYRIRAQFKTFMGKAGFFMRSSRNLVDVSKCPILHPSLEGLLPWIRELSLKNPQLKECHATFYPGANEIALKLIGSVEELNPPSNVVGVGIYLPSGERLKLIGRGFGFISACGANYKIGLDSFLQINYKMWDDFIKTAVGEEIQGRVLELHCGAGFFSVFLARRADSLFSSDINSLAVEDARYNLMLNGIKAQVRALKGAEAILSVESDTLFVNPPRGGLDNGEIRAIKLKRPKRIIYVSCNPATLARDVNALRGFYKLRWSRLVENFPHTYHIESVNFLDGI